MRSERLELLEDDGEGGRTVCFDVDEEDEGSGGVGFEYSVDGRRVAGSCILECDGRVLVVQD